MVEIMYSCEEPEIIVPDPPSLLSALPGEEMVVLSWSPPSYVGRNNITHCNVYRGTSTREYSYLGLSLTMGFTDRLVNGGTTYFYVVTAVNMIGESGISNELSSTPTQATVITATVPGSPQNMSISIENSTNNVVLDWSPPSDDGGETITHYNIYHGTSTEEYTYLGFSQDVGFTDRLVSGGTTYFYVVTAVNILGESQFSGEVSGTIQPPSSASAPGVILLLSGLTTMVVYLRKKRKS
jgi:cellulose 1,4-beta-cellobiosidase